MQNSLNKLGNKSVGNPRVKPVHFPTYHIMHKFTHLHRRRHTPPAPTQPHTLPTQSPSLLAQPPAIVQPCTVHKLQTCKCLHYGELPSTCTLQYPTAFAQPLPATFSYAPGAVQPLAQPPANMRASHRQDTFWQQLFTLPLAHSHASTSPIADTATTGDIHPFTHRRHSHR